MVVAAVVQQDLSPETVFPLLWSHWRLFIGNIFSVKSCSYEKWKLWTAVPFFNAMSNTNKIPVTSTEFGGGKYLNILTYKANTVCMARYSTKDPYDFTETNNLTSMPTLCREWPSVQWWQCPVCSRFELLIQALPRFVCANKYIMNAFQEKRIHCHPCLYGFYVSFDHPCVWPFGTTINTFTYSHSLVCLMNQLFQAYPSL